MNISDEGLRLNARSMKNLVGVHEDLVAVVRKASEKVPFLVTEGLRSKERQLFLVKAGKSQTKNSRHLYGLAVDLCDCDGCYDVPDMISISRAMKSAAAELGVPIVWGGDWKTFKDTPHFELDRKSYPDGGEKKPFVLKPAGPGVTVIKGIVADTVLDAANFVAPDLPDAPIGIASAFAHIDVPSVPETLTQSVTNIEAWKSTGGQLWTFGAWLTAHPMQGAALVLCVAAIWFGPSLLRKRA